MRSRGNSGIPRREPERTKIGSLAGQSAEGLKAKFREASRSLTAEGAGPKPKSRRRSGEDTSGGFRLYARMTARRPGERIQKVLPRVALALWEEGGSQYTRTNEKPRFDVPDQPSSASEIIGWYLRNGYDMAQIRAMFPAFFSDPVQAPAPAWDAVEWHNLWNWNPAASTSQVCDDFHSTEQNPLSPHLELR